MDPASKGALLLIVFTLMSAFFALARSALVNSHRAKLRQLAEEGVRGARWAQQVAEGSALLLITVQFGQLLATLLGATSTAVFWTPALSGWLSTAGLGQALAGAASLLLVTSVVAVMMLLFGDKLPEVVALRDPEGIALSLGWIIHAFSMLFAPIVRLIVRIGQAIAGRHGHEYLGLALVTEEEIMTLVDAGQEEGVIEADEKAMIFSIFQFGETAAREVMVPRIDVVALDIETPLAEALQAVVEAGHSRVPVYRDSIDNVQGILYAKDFLELWLPDGSKRLDEAGQHRSLESLLRPAHFVPESKMLDDLLADLQQGPHGDCCRRIRRHSRTRDD
jgi:putative hemolysin